MRITLFMTTLLLSTFFFACKKEDPTALFVTDKPAYQVKESIQFTNLSEHGSSYFWDFGNGVTSTLKNPGYTYDEPGTYIVTLQVSGKKKTIPAEYNMQVTILDSGETYIEPDHIFANTTWVCDSITDMHFSCDGTVNDWSTNFVSHSMLFNDDNTVLMLNNGTANICVYEILNDTLIGFQEAGYYQTWTYILDGERLTLQRSTLFACPDVYPETAFQGESDKKHFFLQ